MKKTVIVILCLLLVILVYFAGKTNGIMHTVNNAEIWKENNLYFLSIDNNTYYYE